MWNRKWGMLAYVGIGLSFLLAAGLISFLIPDKGADGNVSPLFIAYVLVFGFGFWPALTAWCLAFQYYCVSALLGKSHYIPKRLGGKTVHAFFASIGVGFLTMVYTLPFLAIFAVITFALVGNIEDVTGDLLARGVMSMYGVAAFMLAIYFRFSLIFPAIAVGKKNEIFAAWKLGRGHFFRMALSSVPFYLLISMLEVLPDAFAVLGEDTLAIVFLVLYLLYAIFIQVLSAVWYKELMVRDMKRKRKKKKALKLKKAEKKKRSVDVAMEPAGVKLSL